MLFVSKAFIVITFSFEELIEVRLAVNIPTQRCICPKAEFTVAIGTAETADVEHLLFPLFLLQQNFTAIMKKKKIYGSSIQVGFQNCQKALKMLCAVLNELQ